MSGIKKENEIFNIKPITNIELKPLIKREDIHKKLSNCIINMISTYKLPFYGEFCQFINFYEADIGSCGVNVSQNGMNFYWDRKYVEETSHNELIFTIIHEVFHLLLDHQKRGVGYDLKISNLAADMIINSIIHEELIIAEGLSDLIEIPKDQYGNNSVVFIPIEYDGEPIFEDLYNWLNEKYKNWKLKNGLQEISNSNDSNSNNFNVSYLVSKSPIYKINTNATERYGPFGKSGKDNVIDMYSIDTFFETIEKNKGQTFDIHFDNDVQDSAKKQFVENAIEKVKSRGFLNSNVERVLNKLRKSEKNYIKEIKRHISNDILGNKKSKSITKPNRRSIWGLKGNKKYKERINCILDTSGSMANEFEKVLSYIFQNDVEINLIQCDTKVNFFKVIKNKKELEKIPIKGLGGTTLTPALQYIASNKELNKYNTIILTDGYTDRLNTNGVKGNILILSTSVRCPAVENTKKIRQIIIEK